MIEIMTFRLAAGADEAAFVDADGRLQTEFAYQQPGLMRRTTARSSDGEWIVIDIWATPADADACDELWDDDPVAKDFMSYVDPATVRTVRYTELS